MMSVLSGVLSLYPRRGYERGDSGPWPFLFVEALDYALRNAIRARAGFTITPRKSRRNPAFVLADLDFADNNSV